MDGLHSPWGLFGEIMKERGYTLDYVLWGTAWINLLMERADAPRFTKRSEAPTVGAAGLKELLGQ